MYDGQGMAPARSSRSDAARVVLLSLVAHLRSLAGGFVWDDDSLRREWLRPFTSVTALLLPSGPSFDGRYRPLFFVPSLLDRAAFGDRPFGWHLTNLVLHAAVALLAWAVARELFERVAHRPEPLLPLLVA